MHPIRSFRRRWTLAALLAVLAAPAAAHAQPQSLAGTRVALEPPAGFTRSARFVGFGREDVLASIMVTDVPAPFSQMVPRLTAERFAEEGMALRGMDPVDVGGVPGRLISVAQEVDGIPFHKWVLMFGDDSTTSIVTGTYPADSASLGKPIRRAVLSARRTAPSADPLEGLAYRIDPGARLRVADRVGNALVLNETGTLPNAEPGSALLVIAPSVGETDLSDLEAWSRGRVARLGGKVQAGAVTGGGPVETALGAGYELFADASSVEDGTPLRVYQLVVPDGGYYYLVQAMAGADRAAEWIPAFQAVARTLRRAP